MIATAQGLELEAVITGLNKRIQRHNLQAPLATHIAQLSTAAELASASGPAAS